MSMLIDLPWSGRTYEVCFSAVVNDSSPEDCEADPELSLAPQMYRDRAMCLAAVAVNGMALRYVPDDVKTPSMCLAAVISAPVAIRYVLAAMRTVEICRVAVEKCPELLPCVPDDVLNIDIATAALKGDDGETGKYI